MNEGFKNFCPTCGGEDELFYAKVLASHVLDDICSSPIPSPCPTCSPQTQRGKRERTRSLSKSGSKGQAAREPVLRTRQRTIYTAGRPPWYDTTGQLVEPFVIGICGGSASGKTTMARTIIESLNIPWVTLLSMDSFYKVLNEKDHMLAHNNEYNFDHPDAFDFELMIETISKLKEGRKVEVPIYNFVTHSRDKRMKTMYGANVIIFEGILVFANKKLTELMDMKLFIDTDSDIRLARRLKRDITERGRDLEGVLKQYNKFVKPSFDYYIAPTMVHADLIVPRGGENNIAKDLIVQHIHSQLQQDVTIETPQGVPYQGKRIDTEKICGVSILRAGETMEQALCDVLKDVRLGKILIQTNPETVEPELYYLRLPKDIADYKIILMDATVATGAAAMMAIRVLLDHDVKEEDIFLCSLLMAESGVHTIAYAFPKVQIITSQVDPGVNDKFYIMPGIGNFGDRFFGTEAGL